MRRRLFLAVLLVAGIVATAGVAAVWPRGVRVTVTNRGPEPLVDVVVFVTGNVYRLGTLGVGESQTVSVQTHGESHVELGFAGHAGGQVRLNAGGYFESSGYEGTIAIELEGGVIVRNDHRISIWPSWL
jgi:hypothetical protein